LPKHNTNFTRGHKDPLGEVWQQIRQKNKNRKPLCCCRNWKERKGDVTKSCTSDKVAAVRCFYQTFNMQCTYYTHTNTHTHNPEIHTYP